MIKGFRQIAFLTAGSRVFGLVRDMLYCYFFGASGLLDAWFIAFKIPNLSRRLFGEGAAAASFIPVYSQQLHKDPKEASRLAGTMVTVVSALLAVIVLVGWAAIWLWQKWFETSPETQLILSLTAVMLPYMLMVCLVAILAGILNVHRHFAAPAAAPIVLNIFIIGTIAVAGWFFRVAAKEQLFAVAIAVLTAGLVQIAIQIPPLRAGGISIKPAWAVRSEAFKKIIIMMGPMILALTVTQINTLFDDLIAWWFSASPEKGETFLFLGHQIRYPLYRGCVSHLNVAQRLYQMPLGVFGISLATAIFPVMSSDAARKDFNGLAETAARGIRAAVFIAIPATVGLLLVAKPLVSAAFEHGKFTADDTNATAWTLLFYAFGLTGYFLQQIITRAFYCLGDSKTPMRSALITVVVNIVLNLTLIWFLATAGLALSTAICSYLQVFILLFVLRKRLGLPPAAGLVTTLIKTSVAAVLCGCVGAFVLYLCRDLPSQTHFNILRLVLTVPLTAGAYFLAAKLLHIRELSLFTGTGKINAKTL